MILDRFEDLAMVLLKSRYLIDGMDCAGCATKIEIAARRVEGVAEVNVSLTNRSMTVEHSETTDLSELQKNVSRLGYRISSATARPASTQKAISSHDQSGHHDEGVEHTLPDGLHGADESLPQGPWWRSRKGKMVLASGFALAAAFIITKLVPVSGQIPFIVAMLVGLLPIGKRAVMAAFAGSPFTIEMLMTIAATGAVFIGAIEEAATVVFLFLIGELLEGVAAGKARASIQALTKLVPKTAFLDTDGSVKEVPAETLAIGNIILVKPGERVSADGIIESGEGEINEAPVTGESVPIRKGVGASVFAGTVNGDTALRVRVTAAAADNTIARVVKLVEEAQESKAPTERFIDSFSRIYTPAVVVIAALVAVIPPLVLGLDWDGWIYKGLAILLIGCPCALVISTPAAIAASLSAGARRGLLLKGGAVVEGLRKITLAAFDKTGTLTEGKPKVTDIVVFEDSESDILKFAAALENGSSHPLASAILAKAGADKISIPQIAEATSVGGKGVTGTVEGVKFFLGSPQAAREQSNLTPDQDTRIAALNDEGKTVSVLLRGDVAMGIIAMRDEPRGDALAGLKQLTESGIRTVMLTGDNARTAKAIGAQLGIEVRADLLPEDKLRIVSDYQSQGFVVAKIGDGINDAPALAKADVGIAMGGGTDVALETADAAVLHGRVGDVAAMITLSKRTMGNIAQNITIALGLKGVFLVTTIIGLTGLWPAILADTGATVLVTLNAMRLLRVRTD